MYWLYWAGLSGWTSINLGNWMIWTNSNSTETVFDDGDHVKWKFSMLVMLQLSHSSWYLVGLKALGNKHWWGPLGRIAMKIVNFPNYLIQFSFFFTEILKMFRGGAILPDFWCTGVLDSVHIVLVWRLLCFETSDFVLRKPTTCFIDRKPIFRDETDSGTDHHLFWHRAFS